MYLGQVAKGAVLLVSDIILSFFTAGIAALPFWIIAMIDAHQIGKKLEAGQTVGLWEWF